MRISICRLLASTLCLVASLLLATAEEEHCIYSTNDQCINPQVDYLIVGAGGSGIQMALFLQKYNYSFQILEKSYTAGSFWTKYPVFDELISVNKRVQNATQRFRYDWHSMLETPVAMWDVSHDYFPTGKDWHEYTNCVVTNANIDIEYSAEVESLASDGNPCVHLMDGSTRCARYRVFVGTGLKERDERYLRAIGGVRYSDMNKEMAVGKRVCILGNDNAGFEVAQNVFKVANRVIISGKCSTSLGSITKYTGDVRVKFLDNPGELSQEASRYSGPQRHSIPMDVRYGCITQ